MSRFLTSLCMALCAVFGVIMLVNGCTAVARLLLRPPGTGAPLAEAALGDLIVVVVAVALLAVALAMRRKLRRLDNRFAEAGPGGDERSNGIGSKD